MVNKKSKIEAINVINDGQVIEISFNDIISTFLGIEKYFVVKNNSSLKSYNESKVTEVMQKDDNTLALVLDNPVPTGKITVIYKDEDNFTSIETGKDIVKAYPVPATDVITFEAENLTKIEILSLGGEIVESTTTSGNIVELSVENLPRGLYVARLTSSMGVSIIKIEKK